MNEMSPRLGKHKKIGSKQKLTQKSQKDLLDSDQ